MGTMGPSSATPSMAVTPLTPMMLDEQQYTNQYQSSMLRHCPMTLRQSIPRISDEFVDKSSCLFPSHASKKHSKNVKFLCDEKGDILDNVKTKCQNQIMSKIRKRHKKKKSKTRGDYLISRPLLSEKMQFDESDI